MAATLINAPEDKKSDFHKWTGIAAAGAYLGSAGLAMMAPRPAGITTKRNILWHKRLAWIHGPAMALTMLTGFIAHNDYKKGKKLSTLGKIHGGLSRLVSIPFALSIAVTLYEF